MEKKINKQPLRLPHLSDQQLTTQVPVTQVLVAKLQAAPAYVSSQFGEV